MTKAKQKSEGGGSKIFKSSTAEYFSKNLQQVGFSSPTKAVLTTVKEALDNALDACEDSQILPDILLEIKKLGNGSLKNTDRVSVMVEDNGPGISPDDVPRVFGEYLASSKFGKGRCSRGQQGIGISAATTWAQQTTATGALVISKTKAMKKAVRYMIDVDLKNNKGRVKEKETIDWHKSHGTRVEFIFDGRIQLNGEAGLYNFIKSNILVNPHMTLSYKLLDDPKVDVERVSKDIPVIPKAVEPHPHTMQLGDFVTHAGIFGSTKLSTWLKKHFSRVSDANIHELKTNLKLNDAFFNKALSSLAKEELQKVYSGVQNLTLRPPATQSVLAIGEDALAKSIIRIGSIDFISVHTRKPSICDFKPTQIEVAIARLKENTPGESEEPVTVLRFANRVPLQFDKASCAIVKAIQDVNWKTYGLRQPKSALPLGSFIIAVSIVSPFIKFKNASKETIDASDELVEEIRRALMKCGQNLSKYLNRENKARDLNDKIQHLEQYAPILVDILCRITKSNNQRKQKASDGLVKILEKDMKSAKVLLDNAASKLEEQYSSQMSAMPDVFRYNKEERNTEEDEDNNSENPDNLELEAVEIDVDQDVQSTKKNNKKSSKKVKKSTPKKTKVASKKKK